MTIVEPYRDEEIPRCANCGEKMRVRFADYVEVVPAGAPPYRGGLVRKPIAETEFRSNRRVVHRQLQYGWIFEGETLENLRHGQPDRYDRGDGRKIQRVPYLARLTFAAQDRADWGADGMFCTNRCAIGFAYAAYRAGYRRKEPA